MVPECRLKYNTFLSGLNSFHQDFKYLPIRRYVKTVEIPPTAQGIELPGSRIEGHPSGKPGAVAGMKAVAKAPVSLVEHIQELVGG
jgi:hypothetical protein